MVMNKKSLHHLSGGAGGQLSAIHPADRPGATSTWGRLSPTSCRLERAGETQGALWPRIRRRDQDGHALRLRRETEVPAVSNPFGRGMGLWASERRPDFNNLRRISSSGARPARPDTVRVLSERAAVHPLQRAGNAGPASDPLRLRGAPCQGVVAPRAMTM